MLIKRLVFVFFFLVPHARLDFRCLCCLVIIFGYSCLRNTFFFGELFSFDAYEQKLPINTYGRRIFFFNNRFWSITTVFHLFWTSASQEPFSYVGHLLTMRSSFFYIKCSHVFFLEKLHICLETLFHTVHPLWCQGLIQFSSPIKKKPPPTNVYGQRSKGSSVFSIYTSWQISFSELKTQETELNAQHSKLS